MSRSSVPQTFDLDAEEAGYLAGVVGFVRSAKSTSRPEVALQTGLSRTLVTKYTNIALQLKLLVNGEKGQSTGGRAPRMVDFNPKSGTVLVVELGATGFNFAASDLNGNLSEMNYVVTDVSNGPDVVLNAIEREFDKLIDKLKIKNLWGIGIGVPGPVEFATGLPISPPIMPGWDRYPIRKRFSTKYQVPVWVDNDVNLMALGEHTLRKDPITNELIFVKIGSGIGAGILTHGRIHRGAQGSAGDIGHIALTTNPSIICRCGNLGCLEAVSGGLAIVRDADIAATQGESPYLSIKKKSSKKITVADVVQGSHNGDRWCVERIIRVGKDLGSVLATIVNFHNPSLIVIGGSVSASGDKLLASIRETVLKRSLPLATRDLQIRISEHAEEAGLIGAAEMVISELFSSDTLRNWISLGHPSPAALD